MTTIGVLALQGCVEPHRKHIELLGAQLKQVRRTEDLSQLDGLILPGGESTTMLKLIDLFLDEKELQATFAKIPIWGICAGAILMAKEVVSPKQRSYSLLDITVERNAYGRQNESFQDEVEGYPVSFIRAPKILATGADVKIRAVTDGFPIWVQAGKYMATTFHPELTLPESAASPMHGEFVELCGSRHLESGPLEAGS